LKHSIPIRFKCRLIYQLDFIKNVRGLEERKQPSLIINTVYAQIITRVIIALTSHWRGGGMDTKNLPFPSPHLTYLIVPSVVN